MEYLQTIWSHLSSIQLVDIVDILIVAFLIYKIIPIFRATNSTRIARLIVVILVIAWLTDVAKLRTLHFVLSQFLSIGLLAIIVLFQPELRRMLDHLSSVQLRKFLGTKKPEQEMDAVIKQSVWACEAMCKEKTGALIVFERDIPLDEYIRTGTPIDGRVSAQLLRNIFFTNAALHDGAVIIRDGRIAAAGCLLPLSTNPRIGLDMGTRHRAGLGISEVSDAVAIIVSEEKGIISVAIEGTMKSPMAPHNVERLLRRQLCPVEEQQEQNWTEKLRQMLKIKEKGADDSEK